MSEQTVTINATAVYENIESSTATVTISNYSVNDAYFVKEIKDSSGNITYEKINKLRVGREAFIMVKATGLKDKKLTVNILDNTDTINIKEASNGDKAVPVLINNAEKIDIEATFDKVDSTTDENYTVIKFTLKPKSSTDLKKFTDELKIATDKVAKLYLSVDVHTPNDDFEKNQIVYSGTENENDTEINNIWLHSSTDYLEVYSCYCNRDFESDDVLDLLYHLRDEFNYVSHREKFFDLGTDHFSSNRTSDLANNKDKIDTFKDELNTMFTKFDINICKRKIHFLAQMYIETRHFRSTHEASGVCSGYEGGCDYRGRGMKQITHDYNYLAYYDYVNNTNYRDTFDNLRGNSTGVAVGAYLNTIDPITNQQITTDFYNNTLKPFTKELSEDLERAFDSAGWFSTIEKNSVLDKMDEGLTSNDVKQVTIKINGGENNLDDRKNATKYLKEHFKYDDQCTSQ